MTFFQRLKQWIWRLIYPVFPFVEHALLPFHERKRQRWHLGWLPRGKTLGELEAHLSGKWGFGNHFVAWEDSDQVLSWRKLDGFEHQYHLRVYSDGEIRGHYEMTPEWSPIKHFMEAKEEAKMTDFRRFLGDYLSQEKYLSHLHKDIHMRAPASEITFSVPSRGK